MIRPHRLVLFLILASVVLSFVLDARAEAPREIAKRTFPSVVVLVFEFADGKTMSLGSGFFVRSDIVATNYHVMAGATRDRPTRGDSFRSQPPSRKGVVVDPWWTPKAG
jgi:S1-C subfamily serine protease